MPQGGNFASQPDPTYNPQKPGANYQDPKQLPYELANPGSYQIPYAAQKLLPQGLGQDFFDTIDKNLQLQEKKQMEDLLGFQESRGLLRSGDTNQRLVEDVLGPGEQRRQAAELPLIMGAAEKGQGQDFTRETMATQYQDQLNLAQQQAGLESDLIRLRMSLEKSNKPDFLTQLLGGLAQGVGQGAMAYATGGTSSLFSGGMSMLQNLLQGSQQAGPSSDSYGVMDPSTSYTGPGSPNEGTWGFDFTKTNPSGY